MAADFGHIRKYRLFWHIHLSSDSHPSDRSQYFTTVVPTRMPTARSGELREGMSRAIETYFPIENDERNIRSCLIYNDE